MFLNNKYPLVYQYAIQTFLVLSDRVVPLSLNIGPSCISVFNTNGPYNFGQSRSTMSLSMSTDCIPLFHPNGSNISGQSLIALSLNIITVYIPCPVVAVGCLFYHGLPILRRVATGSPLEA